MIKNKNAKGHSKSLGMSLLFLVYTFGFKLESFFTSRFSHQGSILKNLSSRFKLPEIEPIFFRRSGFRCCCG